MRDQRDQLTAALTALTQLGTHSAKDVNVSAVIATLRDTSLRLNDALQLADDLAAWCATFEASRASSQGSPPPSADVPAWLEPLQAWAQPQPWTLRGHAPRWQLGMMSLIQQPQAEHMLEVWLGDKQEYIGQVAADGHALTAYLDAFLLRPLPAGFIGALQDSISALTTDQPAAPVNDVFTKLEQHLGEALTTSYTLAAFAYDVYRVKTTANLRFVAASRAHKQRLWIPQDDQGRGMVCGWLAC